MLKIIIRKFIFLILILAALSILLWTLGRQTVRPVSWQASVNPGLTGVYAPNNALDNLPLHALSSGHGPEDIAYDGRQFFYTGVEDGRIFKFTNANDMQEFANTGGRPLGMQFDAQQNLIVADAYKGLLSIDPSGNISVLTDSVNGEAMIFVDDLDISADGTIWFSDASQRFGFAQTMYDFVEASMTGRLLSYSPTTKKTTVHIDKLFFANGVALGPNDEFVLVNETGTGRIHRLWLKGDKQGQTDLFADALPANPDNLSFNGQDTFWVALPSKRDKKVDGLADKPFIRTLLGNIPPHLFKPDNAQAFILGLDINGQVKYNLQTDTDIYNSITSVNQYGNKLYIGNLHSEHYAVYSLSDLQ